MAAKLPARAPVVMGDGVIGCSAYHLGKLGWSDCDPGNARMRV